MLEMIKELFKFDNIPIMLIIGVVIGYTIKKIIHLDKQVTNHIPTQIKEVKTEIAEVKTELKTEIKELKTEIKEVNNKIETQFNKLYQILLKKK